MTDFTNRIQEQIELQEREKANELEDLADDQLLLDLIKSHAKRDEIFAADEIDMEEDEENNQDASAVDDDLDTTTKLYIQKIRSAFIPYLKKE